MNFQLDGQQRGLKKKFISSTSIFNFQFLVVFLLIFCLMLPSFSSAQISPPETLEEVREAGERTLEAGEKKLPGIVERIWREEVLPVWLSMWNWLKAKTLPKIERWIMPEYEKRKEYFEKGLEQEKKELKTETPKINRSLWERFKELIR